MSIVTSQTGRDDGGEFVLLPADVAFGDEIDVTIVRSGEVLTIYPKRLSEPDGIAGRDTDVIPERPGL